MQDWDVLTEVAVPPPEQQQQQQQLLSATLTWRGDSSYLATNTLWGDSSSSSGSSGSRVLHIWDRETGQLHATGQSAPGLSAAVAWQPNCRHLFAAAALPPPAAAAAAGQQQLRAAPHQRVVSAAKTAPAAASAAPGPNADTKQQQQQQQQPDSSWSQHILLYERNGLQHGGFDVPSASSSCSISSNSGCGSDVVIHSLHWSSDSRLLAVVMAPPAALQQQQQQGEAVPHEWRLQVSCG
jgi:elongator complex protein 1